MLLVEIRGRSQITIPAEIVKMLGIKEGDQLEVQEKDGGIFLCPVVVYPKNEVERIARLVKEAEIEYSNDDSRIYSDIDKMFTDMGIDLDEV